MGVVLRYDVATKLGDALQFSAQVGVFLPGGNGLGGVLADASDLEQLRFGRAQDSGRIAEMLQQLPHADRADVLNQIQRHQGFAGLHARGIAGSRKRGKRKSWGNPKAQGRFKNPRNRSRQRQLAHSPIPAEISAN